MRRTLLVLVLILAACGEGASDGTRGGDQSDSEPMATTTSPAPDNSTSTPTTSPGTDATTTTSDQSASDTVDNSDLPLAPDFTLDLGSGGQYVLSEHDKPVYLVFWAEW